MEAMNVSAQNQGLRVVAYPGDNKILLAMSVDEKSIDSSNNLAGFAIWRKYDGKAEEVLGNRIAFDYGVSKDTTAKDRKWTDSDKAPFQKFRWVDVPVDGFDIPITYRVRAMYFTGRGQEIKDGPEVTVKIEPVKQRHGKFRAAFTRGYIASQAYADKFGNKDIRPTGSKTPDFDIRPFEAQYEWLGADAREVLYKFLDDCEKDEQAKVDVFAYDLDEPTVIAAICRIGEQGRLRAILDNAPLHKKKGAVEIAAAKMIIAAAGKQNVKQGHFNRFQHNKVFIKRDGGGNAQRVIFGSMNFSVRGIYVQANNVIMVDDPKVAGMFATAFDVAFAGNVKAPAFRKNPIAARYMVGSPAETADLPKFSLALSPHNDWKVSLGPMADRVRAAKSSVLFAVMAPSGSGPVLDSLRQIAGEPTVFSYGTVETDKGIAVQSPNGAMGDLTSFAVLTKNVPAPFTKEFSGGAGMHIHDKFVVVDFNAENPTVFTGSSNLAAGGEQANGDSLAMIEDAAIANMYAIEAVALFDHYHFRKAMQRATRVQPLTLWYPGKPNAPDPWWKPYYDRTKIQMRDRCLFAEVPLPPGMAATKTVDWSAMDEASGGKKPPRKAKGKAKSRSRKAAKSSRAKRSPRRSKAKKRRTKRTASKSRRARGSAASRKSAKRRTTRKSRRGKKRG